MRLADGVLLVVDVLEGVMTVTERAIQQAVQEGLAITLLISKVRGSGIMRQLLWVSAVLPVGPHGPIFLASWL
jgi:predicted membrane GTPase involved in stress response